MPRTAETCDDQRSIDEAEQSREQDFDRTGDTCIDDGGDHGTDLPADGAEHEVRRDDGQQQ